MNGARAMQINQFLNCYICVYELLYLLSCIVKYFGKQ